MDRFEGVIIVKKANIYFNGKVTSRTVLFADGSKKTLGVMLPGEYKFDTQAAETMEVLGGTIEVLLPGNDEWKTYNEGDCYDVPANSSFTLNIKEPCDYCCSYKIVNQSLS